ncbi:hypothetical protein [Wenyingzhuangia sp. IMCC45574]
MRKNQSFLKAVCTGVLALFMSVNLFAQDAVSFADDNTSIANARPLEFKVNYTASDDREIMLSIKNSESKEWIAGRKVKVEKGEGAVSIKLNRKGGFEDGNNYEVNLIIMPVGGKWKDNLDKKAKKPFTIGETPVETKEDVVAVNVSSVKVNKNGVAFVEVNYTALDKRLIAVQIKDIKTKEEIASGRKSVETGSGTVKVRLTKKDGEIKKGENYHLIVSTRPVGATWKEIINKKGVKPFAVK